MTFARANEEEQFHRTVASYLEYALPPSVWFTTIGHGGGGAARGARLKAMGVKAGCPDILIVSHGNALFLELKASKGRLTGDQPETHEKIRAAQGSVYTCRTLEEVRDALLMTRITPLVSIKDGKIFSAAGTRIATGKSRWIGMAPKPKSRRAIKAAMDFYKP
jgi:hypothetical protein